MPGPAIDIARDLIRIPSVTGQEADVVRYIRGRLAAAGFAVSVDEGSNIVARLGDPSGRPAVLLCGHHDVVPVGDQANWSVDPFGATIRDGQMWGRGASDAKGPLASILAAAERLAAEGLPAGATLLVVSVREETSDPTQRGILRVLDRGLRADAGIVGEPTGLDVCLGHRGRVDFAVETAGRTAHGSTPELGVSAVLHMTEVIRELQEMPLPDRPPLGRGSQNIGVIRGGIQTNIVPDRCRIEVDRRITVGETADTVRVEVEAALARVRRLVPELRAKFEVMVGWEPSFVRREEPIVALAVDSVRQTTGQAPRTYHMQGHTDQEWLVNRAGIPTIVLAPGDMGLAHSPDERVPLAQLDGGTEIYVRLVRSLLSGAAIRRG